MEQRRPAPGPLSARNALGIVWLLCGSLSLGMSSGLAADDDATTPEEVTSPPEATAPKEPATAQEATNAEDAAAPKVATTPHVEIIGHYQTGIETSDAASEGSVTYKLIEDRPIMRH